MQNEVYFYQQNIKVLKFNLKKDQAKILFNHYISRKENLQRIKKELPRGYFYMAINTASEDTGLSVQQIRTLIKQFIELGIIKKIEEFPRHLKKPTVWQYVSCSEINDQDNMLTNSQNNIQEVSNYNASEPLSNNQINNQDNTHNNNSKKELSKQKMLNIDNLNDSLLLYNLYPKKVGKAEAINNIAKLIPEYGIDQIERCIRRYMIDVEGRERRYIKDASNFFKEGYVDYLDENCAQLEVSISNGLKYEYDEETGEVIRK